MRRIVFACSTAMLALGLAGAAHAAPITFDGSFGNAGDFSDTAWSAVDPGPGGVGGADLSVDYSGQSSNNGDPAAAFGVGSATPATISQTFTSDAGQLLQVSFYLALNADDGTGGPPDLWAFNVLFDGTPEFSMSQAAPFTPTLETFLVTSTGQDTLTFGGYNDPSYWYLSDPTVTYAAAAVPEPAGAGLVLLGLAALGATRRRRPA